MPEEDLRKKAEDVFKEVQDKSREKLDSARERLTNEAAYETRMANQLLRNSKYELSETFFEPTGASVKVDQHLTTFAAWKASGIERPYAQNLIIPDTIKLYHHESGIITSLENKGKELRLVTRLPIEIVRRLKVDQISKQFPSIETGLFLEKEGVKTDELEVYFDGDIRFKKSMPWRFGRKEKYLESWEMELTDYKNFLERTILETTSAIKSVSNNFTGETKKRDPREVADFIKLGSIDPRFSFEGAVVNGSLDERTQILSRVLQQDTEKEDGVNYEVLVQLPVVRNIGYQLLAKDLAIITGSSFPQFETGSPELLQNVSGKWYAGWGHDVVHSVGDVVYDRHATSTNDYQQSKDVVNKVGKEFLDKKLDDEWDL